MSATAKQQIAVNAELWRVAESGDVDELALLFANGAHVNARNKYGTTALMKAAYHGHARMARALLDRGADPNLARNDKFTALALAAFFGHTETVRILIEHGAKIDLLTRCGTSAQTWATRRTYVEAARCLESHAPAPAPAPVTRPAPAATPRAAAPLVVKTLKDPPEIWDLVHEAPRGNFNARSAFIARLTSMKSTLAFRMAAILLVSIACVVGVMVLRKSQARSLTAEAPAQQNVVATEISPAVSVENTKAEPRAEESTPEAVQLNHSQPSSVNATAARKVVFTRQPRTRAPAGEPVQNAATVQSREVPAVAPVIPSPPVQPRSSASNKPNNSLSPQLITPAQSAPPKGKVIQWP